jgi:hypothetical protein
MYGGEDCSNAAAGAHASLWLMPTASASAVRPGSWRELPLLREALPRSVPGTLSLLAIPCALIELASCGEKPSALGTSVSQIEVISSKFHVPVISKVLDVLILGLSHYTVVDLDHSARAHGAVGVESDTSGCRGLLSRDELYEKFIGSRAQSKLTLTERACRREILKRACPAHAPNARNELTKPCGF